MRSAPTVVRLAGWYAAVTGAMACLPYLSVILSDAGVSDPLVPAAMALLPVGLVVGGPAWSWVADRTGRGDRVLLGAIVVSLAACAAMALSKTPWLLVPALFAFAVSRSPQFPLADALTVRLRGAAGYGRIRAWGSVAYLLAVLVNGRLPGHGPLWLGVGLLGVAAVATLALPPFEPPERRDGRALLRALVGHPALAPMLVTGTLHGVTISAYDALLSLHVRRLELPGRVAGEAIALGVAAEIVVLMAAPWLLARVQPRTLLLVALAVGVPRFWLTGTVTDPAALIALQSLHGLTFGAYWVAGVAIYAEIAPKGLEGATQSLLMATTFGLGSLLAMGLAGVVLRSGTPADVFQALALVALVATASTWAALPRRPGPP